MTPLRRQMSQLLIKKRAIINFPFLGENIFFGFILYLYTRNHRYMYKYTLHNTFFGFDFIKYSDTKHCEIRTFNIFETINPICIVAGRQMTPFSRT
jgi:hypothetical protein